MPSPNLKTNKSHDTSLLTLLPVELWLEILNYLNVNDLLSFGLTSHESEGLVNISSRWNELLFENEGYLTHYRMSFVDLALTTTLDNASSIIQQCVKAYASPKQIAIAQDNFGALFDASLKSIADKAKDRPLFNQLYQEYFTRNGILITAENLLSHINAMIINLHKFRIYYDTKKQIFDLYRMPKELSKELYFLSQRSNKVEEKCFTLLTIDYLTKLTNDEIIEDIVTNNKNAIWRTRRSDTSMRMLNAFSPDSPFYLIDWLLNMRYIRTNPFGLTSRTIGFFDAMTDTVLDYPLERIVPFAKISSEFATYLLSTEKFVQKLNDAELLKFICMADHRIKPNILEACPLIIQRLAQLDDVGYILSCLLVLQASFNKNVVFYTRPNAYLFIPHIRDNLTKSFLLSPILTTKMRAAQIAILVSNLNIEEDIKAILNPENGIIQSLIADQNALCYLPNTASHQLPLFLSNDYFIAYVTPSIFKSFIAVRPVLGITALLQSPLIDLVGIDLLKAAYFVNKQKTNDAHKENRAQTLRFYIRQQQYKMLPMMTPDAIYHEAFDPVSSDDYIKHFVNIASIMTCYEEPELDRLAKCYPTSAIDIQAYKVPYQDNRKLIQQGNIQAIQAEIDRLMRRAGITDYIQFTSQLSESLSILKQSISKLDESIMRRQFLFRKHLMKDNTLSLHYRIAVMRYKFALGKIILHHEQQQFDELERYAKDMALSWRAVNGEIDCFEENELPILPVPLLIRLLGILCNDTSSPTSALTHKKLAQSRSLLLLRGEISSRQGGINLRVDYDAKSQNELAAYLLSLPTTYELFDSLGLKTLFRHIIRRKTVASLFQLPLFLTQLKSNKVVCQLVAEIDLFSESFGQFIGKQEDIPNVWKESLLTYYPSLLVKKLINARQFNTLASYQLLYETIAPLIFPEKSDYLAQLNSRMQSLAIVELPLLATAEVFTLAMATNAHDVFINFLVANSDKLVELSLNQLSQLANKYPNHYTLIADCQRTVLSLYWDDNNQYVQPLLIYKSFITNLKAARRAICNGDERKAERFLADNITMWDSILTNCYTVLIEPSCKYESYSHLKIAFNLLENINLHLMSLPAHYKNARNKITEYCPTEEQLSNGEQIDLTPLNDYIDSIMRMQKSLTTQKKRLNHFILSLKSHIFHLEVKRQRYFMRDDKMKVSQYDGRIKTLNLIVINIQDTMNDYYSRDFSVCAPDDRAFELSLQSKIHHFLRNNSTQLTAISWNKTCQKWLLNALACVFVVPPFYMLATGQLLFNPRNSTETLLNNALQQGLLTDNHPSLTNSARLGQS